MKYALEIIITIFLFFGICFLYKGQQRVSYNNGQGWDGVFYYKITEQIQQDSSSVKGELPYIRRIGTHFLVGKFARISGMNLLDAAFYINLAGVLLTVMLLLFWLRLYLNIFWIRMLLLLLYMLNWLAPLRYTFFCSMTTDAWGSAWFIGGLLLLHFTRKAYNNKRNLFIYVFLFSIVAAIASLFRESNFILALALFFLPNPFKKITTAARRINRTYGIEILRSLRQLYYTKQTLIFSLPIIFTVLIHAYVFSFIEINYKFSYSAFKTVIGFIYSKSLPEYLLGILIAYGPVLLLVPFFFPYFKDLFRTRQELFVLLILTFMLGFVGGVDTERITYMSSFPLVFILLGIAIEKVFYSAERWWLYVLLLLQSIALRVYWTLPDHPANTENIPVPIISLWGNHFNHLYLYSHHGHFLINVILLIEYFVLFVATFFVLKRNTSALGYLGNQHLG